MLRDYSIETRPCINRERRVRYSKNHSSVSFHGHYSQLIVCTLVFEICFLSVDLAQHHLSKNNITAIRRVRKTDNNRIARACGATIAHRTDELREEDIGTGCGLFEIKKIGDEYFTYLVKCQDPKACTVVLRGPSKDILNEVNLFLFKLVSCLILLCCMYVL